MSKKSIAAVAGLVASIAFAGTAMAATFSTTLKLGSTGQAVKDLQIVLNSDPATQVAASGTGSAGMESTYFGGLTKEAVIKFQNKYASEVLAPVGLTSGTGVVGAMTRAKLNTMGGGMTTTPPSGTMSTVSGCTSTAGYSPTTGQKCDATTTTTTLVSGCTSTTGFSSTTGASCAAGAAPVTTTGPVSVALSTDTPASANLIGSQAAADLTHVTFTGTGTVTSVTLKRSGISDQNALTNVYLYDGVNRITDGYAFNNAGDIVMNNISIAVAGSKTIAIKADVLSTAVSTNASIAVSVTGFTAEGSANTVDVIGNTHTFVSGTLATAAFTAQTTPVATVDAGTLGRTMWSSTLQVSTRALQMKNAAFKMVGSAPSDALANIKLFVDGIDAGKVATVQSIQGSNYAVLDFTSAPVSLTTGSHTLEVRGDVMKGSNRTITVSLSNAADLILTDTQFGATNVAATGITTYTSGGQVTINKGSTATTLDTTFNALTNVTGGQTGATIGKFNVKAYGEDIKVSSLKVNVATSTAMTPATGGLANVALYFNGSQIGSTQNITTLAGTSAGTDLTFTFNQTVSAGTTGTFEVKADMQTTAGTNYTAGALKSSLVQGVSNAQGQSSSETVNVPAATIATTGLTVATGALSIAKSPSYLNQTTTSNKVGYKIGSYVLQNTSTSESVRISNLAVAVNVVTMAITNLSNLTTEGATPIVPAASNNFPVDILLAPGASKTIDIMADLGTATSGTASTTLLVTAKGASSNVSLTTGAGLATALEGQTTTVATGTLDNVTLSASESASAQYIAAAGGATDASKSVYTFKASNGTATITELKFTVASSVSGATPVSSIKVGSSSATPVSGEAYLTGLNIEVPSGAVGKNVDVFTSYGNVGINGTASGTIASTTLSYVKYSIGGATTASSTLSASQHKSNDMYLAGSKPSLSVTGYNSTGLIAGENKLLDVTVTPDSKGAITVNTLVFNVATSSATTFKFDGGARIADGSTTITGSTCTPVYTSTAVVTCTLPASYNISTPKTFSLYGTTSGTLGTAGTTSITASLGAASTFSWADISGNSTTAVTTANTTYLTNYPTQSWTKTN